ncbi:sedoheptulose-1,7-bisphosphatase [Trypanosoma conorhini]|uniref:fructose-bisphosphatase n=1 Tax=Trypanosoma conorhini TaxID=83891 RepID=A0A422P4Y7_9TRYP|nr:sedoheptulose-1,7-bisphosphatase [Trypanosoma conorhini]RNF12724.1 sedoheptulose-1,7-bisphosphatase [Trypanosoma conorhini]
MADAAGLAAELAREGAASSVVDVVVAIAEACHDVAIDLRTDTVKAAQASNTFGDEVLSVDVMAERHISSRLRGCRQVVAFVSEEQPTLTCTPHAGRGRYTVSYDPLDGSSIIATNFSVGSIFAVWPGATPIGLYVRDMVASVVAVYGPRTVIFVALRNLPVMEFYCHGDRWSRLRHEAACTLKAKATLFAPGNLRATRYLPWYKDLVAAYMNDGATLRYTGGMVADVCQILVKGDGIFMTPESPHHKVKLRLLFEAAPMAFLMECAGGRSTTGTMNMMDVRVAEMEQKSPVALGCRWDVERYESMCSAYNKHGNKSCSKL